MQVSKVLLLPLALLIAVAMSACGWLNPFADPPGRGEKAEQGYQVSGPIVAALEQYHLVRGSYPENLEKLVPDFIAMLPQLHGSVDGFSYAPSKNFDSYELGFSYAGPGANMCNFSPKSRWKCYGYY